jgi:hypothetical protein
LPKGFVGILCKDPVMDKVSQWAFIAMGHPGYQKVDYRLMIHFSIFSLGRENNNFSSGHRFPLEGII